MGYSICEKDSNRAIGAIALKLNGHTDMTERDDECELGYWLGKPYWGRGFLNEVRVGHTNVMTKEHWVELYQKNLEI